MTNRDTILNELTGLGSDLAAHTPETCYQVPQGYFEGLADQVIARIKALEASNAKEELEVISPLLASIPKKTPYTVPDGYFDAREELQSLSPLLSTISKQNPYSVPDGYFESLRFEKEKQKEKETGKVVAMGTGRKWFKYAAAAVFIGIVAISAVLVFGNGKTTVTKNPTAWIEKNVVKKVSEEQLDEFVSMVSDDKNATQNVTVDIEIKELMKDVPEDEIRDFLKDAGDVSESDDIMLN